jgi:hypothetical protein
MGGFVEDITGTLNVQCDCFSFICTYWHALRSKNATAWMLFKLMWWSYVFQMIDEYGGQRWNDTDRGKPKNSEKNLSQYHFVHHKSCMDWHRCELKLRQEQACD